MADLSITTQDELPGPDGDAPCVLFVNETDDGNTRFLCANVLSARPDLKKYTSIRFRQDLKRHPDGMGPGQGLLQQPSSLHQLAQVAVHHPQLGEALHVVGLELEGGFQERDGSKQDELARGPATNPCRCGTLLRTFAVHG